VFANEIIASLPCSASGASWKGAGLWSVEKEQEGWYVVPVTPQQIFGIFISSVGLAIGVAIGNRQNKRHGPNKKVGFLVLSGLLICSAAIVAVLVLEH
jgi:hypothetical protein